MAKKKTPPKKAAKKKPAAGATNGAPAVGKLNVVPIDEAKIAELAKILSREIPPTHARALRRFCTRLSAAASVPLKNHPKILDAILADLKVELEGAKQSGDGTLSVNDFRDVVDGVVEDFRCEFCEAVGCDGRDCRDFEPEPGGP